MAIVKNRSESSKKHPLRKNLPNLLNLREKKIRCFVLRFFVKPLSDGNFPLFSKICCGTYNFLAMIPKNCRKLRLKFKTL